MIHHFLIIDIKLSRLKYSVNSINQNITLHYILINGLTAYFILYRAVAIDMRGYGESDKPRGVHNYTLDKLVDDIKDLILTLGRVFFFFRESLRLNDNGQI